MINSVKRPNVIDMTFSELIKYKMQDYGYTSINQFGHDIGINPRIICGWINGTILTQHWNVIKPLVKNLDIHPDILMITLRNSKKY